MDSKAKNYSKEFSKNFKERSFKELVFIIVHEYTQKNDLSNLIKKNVSV